MAPRTRIAFLTSAGTWRGSTVSLTHIARGLRDRGHDTRLLVCEAEVARQVRDLGLDVDVIPVGDTGPREVWSLRQSLRTRDTRVLVVDRPRDFRLAGYTSLLHPVRLINRFNLSRRDPPRDISVRLACSRTDLTVFTTRSFAERVLQAAPFMRRTPYTVIGSAVDTGTFRPDPEAAAQFRRRYELGDQPFLLAAGALVLEKRHDLLLNIMSDLGERAPLLVVCGTGMESAALARQGGELGVRVLWPGLLPPDAMRGAYNAATVLIHLCPIETFGLSVAEAMCCGTPVIGVRGGGVPELLGDAGVLLPPDDRSGIGNAILELMADQNRRAQVGAALRRRAQAFSLDSVVGAWDSAISSVAAG